VVFTGCVGDDDLAGQLKAANARDGLDDVYYVKTGEKTGVCAVVITGHHRYVSGWVVCPSRWIDQALKVFGHHPARGREIRTITSLITRSCPPHRRRQDLLRRGLLLVPRNPLCPGTE